MTHLPAKPSPESVAGQVRLSDRHPHARLTTWLSGITLAISWLWVVQPAWRQTSFSMHPWAVGDWVINLQGGFVRRGILGELLFSTGVSADQAAQVVIGLQVVLLAGVYFTSFRLFLGTSRSPAWAMLLLSPAFTLFPLLSFDGGLRKELLTLVSISLLGLLLAKRRGAIWIVFPFAIYVVAAAGHETASLTLPAFLYLLWFGYSRGILGRRAFGAWAIAFTSVAAAALAWAVAYPGTATQVQGICRSWLARGASPEACTGSISALDDGILDVIRQVSLQFPEYFSYLPLAVLAAAPLALLRVPKSVWILLGLTYACLVPVFLTGIDYGRWIYLATGVTSIVTMTVWASPTREEVRVPLVVAVLYVTLWSLPYTGPVTQAPLFTRIVEGPYHLFAVWLGRATGVS